MPLYETLLNSNPEDGELRFRRARALMAANRKNEALPLLIQSFDSGFGNPSLIAWMVAAEMTANQGSVEAIRFTRPT